ncbi:MAG: tetratricopeptide repeat protein [Magnetococcales bacterium]|nr:tetratricopeptide repeat protein [Magnetococcales bacterium]
MKKRRIPPPAKNRQSQVNVEAAYVQAVEHFNAQRYVEAESVCNAILQISPNHVATINVLGVIAQRYNRHDLAVGLFKKATDIDKSQVMALHNLGLSNMQLGQFDAAAAVFQRAIAVDKRNAQLHADLGTAQLNSGKLDMAVRSYKKAIAIKPNFADAHINLGVILKEQGKLDEAAASYNKAIKINPNFAEAYNNLGIILQEQGNAVESIESYSKAIALNPDYADAHNNLGNILRELERPDEAVTSYRKAIAIRTDFADAHYNLGISLKELGRLHEAAASYQLALSIAPDSSTYYHGLRDLKEDIVEDYILSINNSDDNKKTDATQLIAEGTQKDKTKVNLLYCPFVDPISPPLGIACLKGYLNKFGNAEVNCLDLNLRWHKTIADKKHYNHLDSIGVGEQYFNNKKDMFSDIEKYKKVTAPLLDSLQETHISAQYELCYDNNDKQDEIISYLEPFALSGNPDVVGFSILLHNQLLCSLLLAKKIKQKHPEKIIVFGGAAILSSFDKLIYSPFVDFVVSDAGEVPFKELLDSIAAGATDINISGVSYKTTDGYTNNDTMKSNLNHDAYPDFSDINMEGYFTSDIVIPIMSSKGCFWSRCSFCEESSISKFSIASVERVADEVEYHYSKGYRYFQFVDEMISAKRLKMIATEIIKRGIKIFFYATLRPSSDFNTETLQLMHQAGFRYIIWGVESCNPRVLELVNKGTTIETIRSALKMSTDAGIRNHIFIMVGFPTETPAELFDTMQFIYDNRQNIHCVHNGTFVLCKGTEIFQNPEKFEVEIEYSHLNPQQFKTIHKNGTTGQNAFQYFLHYQETFIEKIPDIDLFVLYKDHALVYYSKFPLGEPKNIQRKIPKPVPSPIY